MSFQLSAFSFQPFRLRRSRGVALVLVVIVIAILTIMCVAFLQSMRIDRLTARAYLNKVKAEMAVEAGVEMAIQRLVSAVEAGPYHAVGYYDLTPGNDSDVPIPVVYAAENFGEAPLPYPLISVAQPQTDPGTLDPTSATDWVEMNMQTDANDFGWIGSPSDENGNLDYRSHRAPWIELLADSSLPEQPDPEQPDYNPVVARVAFYIEDESSKLNYRLIGNDDGAGGRFVRSTDPDDLDNLDLGALPLANGQPLVPDENPALNRDIVDFYQGLGSGLIDPGAIVRSSGSLDSNIYDRVKFYGTVFSESNELAGTGRPRVNLNAIVTNSYVPEEIASDLDDILYVITGQHTFDADDRDENTSLFFNEDDLPAEEQPLPEFGQRFYPGTVSDDHADKYLLRIAANIRDYIDTDSQPTYVDVDGFVVSDDSGSYDAGTETALETGEEPSALGKEAIPYFQEHMWRGTEVGWRDFGTSVRGIVRIDHYLEFYNPSTKDWEAPEGTKIRIYDLPYWSKGAGFGGPTQPYESIVLDISTRVFPAGEASVITTDPSPSSDLLNDMPSGVNLIQIDPEEGESALEWRFQSDEDIDGTLGAQLFARRNGVPQEGTTTDYETKMVWGTSNGYVSSHPYIAISIFPGPPWNFKGEYLGDDTRWYYSSSLAGDAANVPFYVDEHPTTLRSGDPRSLDEQLAYQGYTGGFSSNQNQTRFYGNEQTAELTGEHTLGRAYSQFVSTSSWSDRTPALADNSTTAYAIVSDGAMQTIGELGHIYDPHRLNIQTTLARGGGRTFRFGQSDDVVPDSAVRFDSDWENCAWRLCDLFGTDDNTGLAFLEPTAEGKINLNGILRDGGASLKAALREFQFLTSPASAPSTNGQLLRESEIDDMVESAVDFLIAEQADGRPAVFMERGEISEIDYFQVTYNGSNLEFEHPTDSTVANQELNNLNDRAREEIFRRLVELVTTRSTTFAIYVLADTINQQRDGTLVPVSRERGKVVVRLSPRQTSGSFAPVQGYSPEIIYETK